MRRKYLCLLILFFLVSRCTGPESNSPAYNVVVYGGTSSGVIAAYGAKMLGKSVLLIEPGTRIGGMTSGGLGQTDIGNKYAVTGLAMDFYRRLGNHYHELESWKFEPGKALQVYQDFVSKAEIPVVYNRILTDVRKEANRIKSISISDPENRTAENPETITGQIFIDCSYEGDLMAMAGVDYIVGREPNVTYGETINGVQLMEGHQFPDDINPFRIRTDPGSGFLWGIGREDLQPAGSGDKKVQAYNFRICLTDDPGNLIPVTKPDRYDSDRYELLLRLFEAQPEKRDLNDYFIWSPMPNHKTDINNKGAFSTDMIGMNYDYPEGDRIIRRKIFRDHVDYTKGLLYFFGHDGRVPQELRQQMLKWGYPSDEYTENDHWTPQLYVREARRMIGAYIMTEQHCRGDSIVPDPVALAAYTMDSHNCQRLVVNGMVKNEGNVEVGGFPPYPISYHCILPKESECSNLVVPVCLSASHIAYGSIRMEPVFMVLGEVAAVAASMAIDARSSLQAVDYRTINKKIKSDPLLDGTPPDIYIDNEDPEVVFSGPWHREGHFMRNYKNSLEILDNPAPGDKCRFNITNNVSSAYNIYYYCPSVTRESDRERYPQELTVTIHAGDQTQTTTLDYSKNLGSWGILSRVNLQANASNYVEIRASDTVRPFIADALLLIPVKEEESGR